MTQTVVGLFRDETDAQKAINELANLGISREYVDISKGNQDLTTTTGNDSDSGSENGVTRFFKSLFGNDSDDADRYSNVSRKGYWIVTVHAQTGDQAEEAADILDNCGAVDVDEDSANNSSTQGYYADNTSSDYDTTSNTGTYQNRASNIGDDTDNEVSIDRIEEELEVGKRTKQTGGVRVRSRIVEKPVEEHVRLRDERVTVERTPVDRVVSDSEIGSFQDQDIEMTERTEVPVVNKQARVVEEITVRKDVTERDETIHETLRNTEVDVEDLDKDDLNSNRSSDGNQYNSL
ncbi:MAG: YsnF/AvaK domain-containing protein [Ferruginibacter sp.]